MSVPRSYYKLLIKKSACAWLLFCLVCLSQSCTEGPYQNFSQFCMTHIAFPQRGKKNCWNNLISTLLSKNLALKRAKPSNAINLSWGHPYIAYYYYKSANNAPRDKRVKREWNHCARVRFQQQGLFNQAATLLSTYHGGIRCKRKFHQLGKSCFKNPQNEGFA